MITKYSFGALVTNRLSATHTFNDSIRACEENEKQLEKELMEIAEKVLQKPMLKYLTETELFSQLLAYGSIGCKISHDDDEYGFKDADDIKKQFTALKRVWKGGIAIRFSHDDHRTRVNISAVIY